jgi:hypothetical protein
LPAPRNGKFVPLWCDSAATDDDGVFAFAREAADGSRVVVVINAADRPARTGAVPGGATLRPVVIGTSTPGDQLSPRDNRLPAPPCSAVVWK